MTKILVTGGAGYIGSHTLVELSANNFKPVIVDNLCNTSIQNIKGAEKIIGKHISYYNVDCTNEEALNDVFEKEKIEGAIHFAAYKSVEESVRKPEKYHSNNIGSLQVLLNIMKKHKVENIIFSSSCTVYGESIKLPITEEESFKTPKSPYGYTKQIGERIIKDLVFKNTEIKSISLRYFNPIGAHESILIGENPIDKPQNLVPMITQTAIGKYPFLNIYGNDYKTRDGTCIRDYINVMDLADAHVSALSKLIKMNSSFYDVYNVGTGKGTSVLEVIDLFEKSNNLKLNYKFSDRRDGDVESAYASCDKINK